MGARSVSHKVRWKEPLFHYTFDEHHIGRSTSYPGSNQENRVRGVAFSGDRRIAFIDVPDPTPGEGEVVVEIRASGMCGSDLHYFRSATGSGGPVAAGAMGNLVIAGH